MADCKYYDLLRSWSEPTSREDRTILLKLYNLILTDISHGPDPYLLQVWNFFQKTAVEPYEKELIMDKPGLVQAYCPGYLEQGERWAPQRQIAVKGVHWTAYNPIAIESKISRYANEKELWQSSEQMAKAAEREAWAFKESLEYFKEMLMASLFMTLDEYKKHDSVKSDGKDGINQEIVESFDTTSGSTNGYPYYQQNLSLEKVFFCYKDGAPVICCSEDDKDSCKPYKVTKHPLKETLTSLQKIIATNTIAGTKSTLNELETRSSEEHAKLYGLMQTIKSTVAEMIYGRTSKFNICGNAADPAKCCDEDCKKLFTDHGINLGLCKTCTENNEKKCCCYNQTRATKDELALFVNPQDLITLQEVLPLLEHPNLMDDIASYVGVGHLFILPHIKPGEMFVINRKTIGIHPISTTLNSDEYREAELTNIWIRIKFHLVLYPFHCIKFTKPT